MQDAQPHVHCMHGDQIVVNVQTEKLKVFCIDPGLSTCWCTA